MYQNLQCEMVRNGITNKEISKALNVTERTLRNKLKGLTSFFWDEACTIQQEFFPTLTKDYLFATEKDTEANSEQVTSKEAQRRIMAELQQMNG